MMRKHAVAVKDDEQVSGKPIPEKRLQIFFAASRLFLDRGYENVSMDGVAEEAGVSKQTVYNHFPSKEELFRQTIALKCSEYGLGEGLVDYEQSCEEALLKIARHFSALLFNDQVIRMYRLTIGGAGQHREVSQMFYEAGPASGLKLVKTYFDEQVVRRRLDIADTNVAAVQFLSMLMGNHWKMRLMNIDGGPDQTQIDQYLVSSVEMFVRAHRLQSKR